MVIAKVSRTHLPILAPDIERYVELYVRAQKTDRGSLVVRKRREQPRIGTKIRHCVYDQCSVICDFLGPLDRDYIARSPLSAHENNFKRWGICQNTRVHTHWVWVFETPRGSEFFGSEFSRHPEGLSFSDLSFRDTQRVWGFGSEFLRHLEGLSFSGLSFRDTQRVWVFRVWGLSFRHTLYICCSVKI